MATPPQRYRVGEVRPSQILFSAGPASVVDLPNMSVIVMGIDDWDLAGSATVTEHRLLAQVRKALGERGSAVTQLRLPPVAPEGADANPFDESARIGVPVAPFPGWMLCPQCRLLAPVSSGLFRLKGDLYRPDRTRYVHENCRYNRHATVIPVRFLVACTRGHMDDFPWSYFLHGPGIDCIGSISLMEYGLSGTAADIELKCNACKATRRMSEGFGERGKKLMPRCRGRHPHLRAYGEDGCPEQMEGILLGASNSWFPISLAALSIPGVTSRAAQAVERNLAVLEGATSLDGLRTILTTFKAIGQFAELTAHSPEELWDEVEKQRSGGAGDEPAEDLKPPEWRAFSQADPTSNWPDFRLVPAPPARDYERYLEKTVLVEQVREVRALLGFTRIESPYDFAEGEELREEAWGPLCRSKQPRWVPVSETRGEGIFLQFSEAAIADWLARVPALRPYGAATFDAHVAWRRARNIPNPDRHFPGLRYILLHTFAHALMRQLAIECGYSAASLSERIYSAEPEQDDGPMAGVLIYTSAPDSEGTLGGLVSLGQPATLGRHVDQALDSIMLCASDPLCAEHDPRAGTASLHWAACHACLFAPETSCERGNRYLDRGLLVQTVKDGALAFFRPGT